MISPTDLLHPSPAPHFKTVQVFLIYCPQRPSFSTIRTASVNLLTVICLGRGRSMCPSVNLFARLSSIYNQLAHHYKVSIQTEFWLITLFIHFHEIT